jgi:hypothetical protein
MFPKISQFSGQLLPRKFCPTLGTGIAYRLNEQTPGPGLSVTATYRANRIDCKQVEGRWTTLKRLWVIIFNIILLSVPSALVWAAAEKAEALEKKVDVTKLSGINYFFASWYNDNMWLYAIIVTALMGVMGMLIALVTDVILKMIGMEVSKIEHHE